MTEDDRNYGAFSTAWRRGVVGIIEDLSIEKPLNGWFVPNCDDGDSLLGQGNAAKALRMALKVPLFAKPNIRRNVLQVLNSWIKEGPANHEHQAIDILGLPNPACSKIRADTSLNLDLKPELPDTNQDLPPIPDFPVPILPSGPDDVRIPPSPRELFAVDPVFSPPGPQGDSPPPETLLRSYPDQQLFQSKSAQQQVSPNGGVLDDPYIAARTETNNQILNRKFQPQSQNSFGFGRILDGSKAHLRVLGQSLHRDIGGILPESAFVLSNRNSRKARLWRKVYYLEYLRELYKR